MHSEEVRFRTVSEKIRRRPKRADIPTNQRAQPPRDGSFVIDETTRLY